jgi:flagellin
MSVINTNIAATLTANSMRENQRSMENTMERLSTGKRINSASDDAAGLAIETRMESQIRGLTQAARNANDGISMLQTADGAASEMSNMLQRMRELAVQAQQGTLSTDDKTNLNAEFAALATEIDRIATDTTFNNIAIMASTQDIEISVGADESDTITISMSDFNLAEGASGGSETRGTFAAAAASEANLQTALTAGTISVSDGTKTISIDLAFVQQANNDGSITAAAVTHDQVGKALEAAAAAKADFSIGEFTSNGDGTFSLKEKAGLGGTNGTVSFLGAAALVAEADSNMTTGVAATGIGAMGENIADFATAGTGDDVDTTGVIEEIDAAIKGVASARAGFGAVINRLEYTVDSLNTTVLNTQAAKSRIVDADYAAETTELARTQIIAQASTAMLSQANQAAQSVLALLK